MSLAHTLSAVNGSDRDLVPLKTALLSVSDKTGLIELATALSKFNVKLLSTGGTAAAIRAAGLSVTDVSEHTGSPEIMDGRVKTLHPKIHGGLLGVRGNAKHEEEAKSNGVAWIDLVVINLYAFSETVAKGSDFSTCVENIDIGGPSMLRSASKNHASVAVLSHPGQYAEFLSSISANASNGGEASTSLALRKKLASAAFARTAAYDTAISSWFAGQLAEGDPVSNAVAEASGPLGSVVQRTYSRDVALKYGCNPHQNPSFVGRIINPLAPAASHDMPFEILNGTPGYINLLDAVNAYQLASELRAATGLAAAASFKHVSPAGAAVAVPLSDVEAAVYDAPKEGLTPVALADLRARNADPMCSFGDFAAVSDEVDEATAMILKPEVSDGIIAPSFTPEALAILKTKKSGAFIILQAKKSFRPPPIEYREVYGMAFAQRRNDVAITTDSLAKIVTKKSTSFSEDAKRDLVIALIAIKYTQSNSVGYARDGMMVGVGAGQQSRVDCVKLAGRKVATWYLRQHPKVQSLPFKAGTKRTDKVNARVRYIEGDMAEDEYKTWVTQFESTPEPLTESEKKTFLAGLKGVSLASDAFFPFRDSIDCAARYGVSFVAQPGGSVKDEDVTQACDEYAITQCHGLPRLFHH
jgi:phosphoribosylaminoimidazolecarboxamide formyltransferase / IMP cyclohydrolase